MRNKKAEVFFLCSSSTLVVFLLSPKDPPSCWRAKPIIKARLYVFYLYVAEHGFFRFVFSGLYSLRWYALIIESPQASCQEKISIKVISRDYDYKPLLASSESIHKHSFYSFFA